LGSRANDVQRFFIASSKYRVDITTLCLSFDLGREDSRLRSIICKCPISMFHLVSLHGIIRGQKKLWYLSCNLINSVLCHITIRICQIMQILGYDSYLLIAILEYCRTSGIGANIWTNSKQLKATRFQNA